MSEAFAIPKLATKRAVDEWLDEPIPAEEAAFLLDISVQQAMAEKLDTLARLAPSTSPMLDCDQTGFGVVAEVCSKVGPYINAIENMGERHALFRRLYRATQVAADKWAREHGQEEGVKRFNDGALDGGGLPDAVEEQAQGTLF